VLDIDARAISAVTAAFVRVRQAMNTPSVR
jgi:hypothetical protein